jgi:hypothetical protein
MRRSEDLLAMLKREVRVGGLRATPFRIGVKVGCARLTLTSPYTSRHACDLFERGVAHGLTQPAKVPA